MKYIMVMAMLCVTVSLKAQTCSCEKEFLHIKSIVENGFAGFPDRLKALSPAGYQKKVDELLKLTRGKFAYDECPLIIDKYLDLFKSHHLGFSLQLDYSRTDTNFVNQRPVFDITDKKIAQLKQSRSWEGIYYFRYDSSIKVAVIKDPTPLHDYIGVTLASTRPTWTKGLIKFEGKLLNDSLMKGVLYMRNHRPKEEYFPLWSNHNMLGGDWRREGAPIQENFSNSSSGGKPSPVIDAKSLSANTFYIKMGSSDPRYIPVMDSLLRVNEQLLNTTPNLILDIRENGGGADASWEPFIPYFYTNPIKMVGADMRVSDTTLALFKKQLENKRLSKEDVAYYQRKSDKMAKATGAWITHNEDEVLSSLQPKLFPKKIVILIDRWCGSASEEFLLAARQSSKVILAGENTIGNLDYSNIEFIPFVCYPYTLTYATTRSRRLDIGQGIDNVGIVPQYRLPEGTDWVQEALKIVEKQ